MRRVVQWVSLVLMIAPLWPIQASAYDALSDIMQKEFEVNNAATVFRAGNYESLTSKIENYAKFGQTTTSGDWYLTSQYDGLARVVDEALGEAELDGIEDQARDWITAFPKSASSYLGYATILIRRGLRIANGGPFPKETIARVRKLLDDRRDIVAGDAHFHAVLVWLAIAEGAELDDLRPLLEAAAIANPSYSAPWILAAEHLIARSADGASDLEAMARIVLERTRSSQNAAQYTRIYQHALEVAYGTDLFKATKAEWSDLKAGIQRRTERFPYSGLNANEFAVMACLASDQELLTTYIKHIEAAGRTPPEAIWGSLSFFEQCRSWASGQATAKRPLQPENPMAERVFSKRLTFDPRLRMTATFESDLRARLRDEFIGLVYEEGFRSLEKLSERYRTTDARTPSGLPVLWKFYGGIEGVYGKGLEENYDRVEGRLKSYLEAYPSSPTPIVLYADLMKEKARLLRDRKNETGMIDPFAEKAADKLLDQISNFLDAHKEVGQADPAWYIHMIDVGRFQLWPIEKIDALVDEGAKRHRGHYNILFAGALVHIHNPATSDVSAEIERYARNVSKYAAGDESAALYARIYWFVEQVYFGYGIFQYSYADWPYMRRGFETITKTYPGGWNENAFAYFSCLAGDAAKLRELLRVVETYKEEPPWEIWRASELRNACLEFARSTPVEANPAADASAEQDPT